MAKISKDSDQKKGDELLRRLLKTPPDRKFGASETDQERKLGGNAAKSDRPQEEG